MTIPHNHIISNRTPDPVFKSIKSIDRVRNMMLGQPVERVSRVIPFGYEMDPEHPKMLRRVDLEFKLLILARRYLASSSYLEVAAWVSKASGKKLTHTGLHKIMRERFPLGTIDSDGRFIPATTAAAETQGETKAH